MPYRTLNTDEVAQYLNLPRADIERLCKDRDIPFEMRGSHVVFRQRDIEAWASQRILSFNTSRLVEYHRKSAQQTRALPRRDTLLPGMIRLDCVAPAMTAKTKASVLRDLAAVADRTGLVCDRTELVASLQAREKLCPTAVPGGVAFLHPRQQQPFLFQSSFLVLGRTIQPIHFGSPDGQPTDLFFLVCCQDDKLHLHTLARLCLMSQKTDLLAELRAGTDASTLHERLLGAEQTVVETLAARPASGRLDGQHVTAPPPAIERSSRSVPPFD
jgi:excisionase family DNA binding protein